MSNLSRADFHAALNSNINQYAKDSARWWAGNVRGSSLMVSDDVVALSDFDRGTSATAGDADASNVVDVIKAEAVRCTAMRKVYTARYYSGSNYSNGDRKKEWGIAALNDNYRQDIYSLDTAGGYPTYVSANNDADWSNLSDLIQSVKDELYDRMHNSDVIDLSSCHTKCHGNCILRSRR